MSACTTFGTIKIHVSIKGNGAAKLRIDLRQLSGRNAPSLDSLCERNLAGEIVKIAGAERFHKSNCFVGDQSGRNMKFFTYGFVRFSRNDTVEQFPLYRCQRFQLPAEQPQSFSIISFGRHRHPIVSELMAWLAEFVPFRANDRQFNLNQSRGSDFAPRRVHSRND